MLSVIAIFFFAAVLFFPEQAMGAPVVSEIAWMGTAVSSANEWIELFNGGSESVDLGGWRLEWRGGQYGITVGKEKCQNTVVSAGGYFLLERTNDATVPEITADCIYTGALSNSGEALVLKDSFGKETDRVDGGDGWKIGTSVPAGNNDTKETAQRLAAHWVSAASTPRAENGTISLVSSGAASQNSSSSAVQSALPAAPFPLGGASASAALPPLFRVDAGGDRTVGAGSLTDFLGVAVSAKEGSPLEHTRFLWNFGDGEIKEGRSVGHIFQIPGVYIVGLHVSSPTLRS